ncbi:MAG: Toxin [Myxococcaceae bacterium]|nr:Toxin [Myxococcaceae bacterium]
MIRYSPKALEALAEIVEYSNGLFGPDVRAIYMDDLRDGIERLERFPHFGQDVAKRHGLKRYRRGRHFIYYRATAAGVYVVDLVHEQMLPPSHLS